MLTQKNQGMTQNNIRRRHDGSIDMAFYMARGRQARSAKAHGFKNWAGKIIATMCSLSNLQHQKH